MTVNETKTTPDINGKLQIILDGNEYYVIGKGYLIPCQTLQEANEELKRKKALTILAVLSFITF